MKNLSFKRTLNNPKNIMKTKNLMFEDFNAISKKAVLAFLNEGKIHKLNMVCGKRNDKFFH